MRETDDMLFGLYAEQITGEGKSPNTVEAYRRAVSLLSDSLPAGTDLLSATPADINRWAAAGARSWADSSLATYSRRARTFYAWCIRAGQLDLHPMRAIKPVKETEREIDIPAPADLAALIAQCAADAKSSRPRADGRTPAYTRFFGARDHAILRVMIEPGTPRASELARMPLAALDMRAREILILGKGKKERYVPFGTKAGLALMSWLRERARHPGAAGPDLWLSGGGGHAGGAFTRSGLQQMLQRRCDRAGIGRIHPHQIRHFAADEWFAAGGSQRDAKKLFGWDSDAMPSRYASKHAGRRAREHARELSLGDRVA